MIIPIGHSLHGTSSEGTLLFMIRSPMKRATITRAPSCHKFVKILRSATAPVLSPSFLSERRLLSSQTVGVAATDASLPWSPPRIHCRCPQTCMQVGCLLQNSTASSSLRSGMSASSVSVLKMKAGRRTHVATEAEGFLSLMSLKRALQHTLTALTALTSLTSLASLAHLLARSSARVHSPIHLLRRIRICLQLLGSVVWSLDGLDVPGCSAFSPNSASPASTPRGKLTRASRPPGSKRPGTGGIASAPGSQQKKTRKEKQALARAVIKRTEICEEAGLLHRHFQKEHVGDGADCKTGHWHAFLHVVAFAATPDVFPKVPALACATCRRLKAKVLDSRQGPGNVQLVPVEGEGSQANQAMVQGRQVHSRGRPKKTRKLVTGGVSTFASHKSAHGVMIQPRQPIHQMSCTFAGLAARRSNSQAPHVSRRSTNMRGQRRTRKVCASCAQSLL